MLKCVLCWTGVNKSWYMCLRALCPVPHAAQGSRGQVATALLAALPGCLRAWLLLLMLHERKRFTNSGMATMMPGDA